MKTLVVSDNHRDDTRLDELLSIYDDIDLWLHCGDSEFYEDHRLWDSFKTVRGNMDWENGFPETRVEEGKNTKLVVLHGHQHRVKKSFDLMATEAHKYNAGIVFYGHTHVAKVDKVDDIYFINPGSISQPRGDLLLGSYAIFEETDNDAYIHFYDWNHNKLPELSQKLD